jgi:hypothetical protein
VARVPFRSPEFLAYVHLTRTGPCVACGAAPWVELHHFGDDGGTGCKPSDALVVRLCRACHADGAIGRKLRALRRDGADALAADYLRDAAASLEAWAVHLAEQLAAHQADGCARDELVTWLAEYDGRDPAGAETWLLAWATRRRENALEGAAAALVEVEHAGAVEDARFVAARARRAWGL